MSYLPVSVNDCLSLCLSVCLYLCVYVNASRVEVLTRNITFHHDIVSAYVCVSVRFSVSVKVCMPVCMFLYVCDCLRSFVVPSSTGVLT